MKQDAALLMTDLVDSTLLSERLGDEAMSEVWQAHDRVSRNLLAAWRGTEINRSDGFLLRFETVSDAACYANAYHDAIASLSPPLTARAGLHFGTVIARESPADHRSRGAKPWELGGLSIPTVARVMSIALPRQTLMTPEARDALGKTPLRVVSHGHWRFKGLGEPIEVFEVADVHAPFDVPVDMAKAYRVVLRNQVWVPIRAVPHSLPAERNAFVGREHDLRDLDERLDRGVRLITVCGIGGIGKTRLTQRYGWSHLGDYMGGIWFCDLASAQSLDGLCSAVAQGLDLSLGNIEPVEQIGNAIAGRGQCLIVLDNFEQIAKFALSSLGRWLDQAVDATFIVTSRSRLGLDGEQVLPIAPLDALEGGELFALRAAASGLEVDRAPGDEALIRELIDTLDGLPLAIELAAARAHVLDIRKLLSRMSQRFTLLTSGGGRPSRQATLRTTFDWSWELLNTVERRALAQLSTFEGGFDLPALEAVCDLSDVQLSIEPIDALQSLLDKSWLQRTFKTRFTMLKSVQEYAMEKLRADATLCRATELRHGTYYGSLDEEGATIDQGIEVDNLIAATRRAVTAGAAARAAATLERCWFVLKLRGPYRTASVLAEEVLALNQLQNLDRAVALFVAGDASQSMGAIADAIAHFESGLVIARACQSRLHEARLLCALGEQLTNAARGDEARTTLDAARMMADSLGNESLQCAAFKALGNLRQSFGDAVDAQHWYERALEIAQRLADRRWEGGLFGNLGGMHHLQGHVVTAQRYYDLAIARAEMLGDKRWENNARCNLGLLLGETGDLVNARLELERASTSAREMGHSRLECVAACNLGVICANASDVVASRRYYERALELANQLHDLRTEAQTRGYFGLLHAQLGEHAEARRHFDIGEAVLVKVHDELSLGSLLCQQAEARLLANDPEAARKDLARAHTIASQMEVDQDSPLRIAIERLADRFGDTRPN